MKTLKILALIFGLLPVVCGLVLAIFLLFANFDIQSQERDKAGDLEKKSLETYKRVR